MVALNRDVSPRRAAVLGIIDELADLDLRGPVGAPQLVLEQLRPVEPVFDVRALYENARGIPFAARLHDASRRRVQRVRGPRGSEATRAVGVVCVVEQLEFGSAPID